MFLGIEVLVDASVVALLEDRGVPMRSATKHGTLPSAHTAGVSVLVAVCFAAMSMCVGMASSIEL